MSTTTRQQRVASRAAAVQAERPLWQRLWYDFLRVFARLASVVCFRIRCRGREHIPATGGVLLLSNHQSHLDPPLIGQCVDRRLNYLARDTLFRFSLFRRLIESVDAIPIDREGLGLSGLKETLKRLRRGEIVLIFPEGTRTTNGEVAPFKPGFSALARRAGVPLLPVALDGAYQAFPRGTMFPRPGVIHIQFGRPIQPQELGQFDERELVAEMEQRIRDCHAAARRQRALSCRGYPPQ